VGDRPDQLVLARETPDIESSSADYAGRFAGPVGAWFLEVQAAHALALLSPWPGAKVLDVGGGHAQLVGPLSRAGHKVTVLGSTPECGLRPAGLDPPAPHCFVTGDLLQLPFADGGFDVVTAFRMLAHVQDWPRFLAELCRVARHAVVVDYPELRSMNFLAERLFAAKLAVEKNTRPFRCFHGKDLHQVLTGHGFRHLSARPQFFWPMALHRGLRRPVTSRGLEGLARGLGLTKLLGSPVILRAARRRA
jgi:SAM-dependent methyltransferase